MSTTLAALQRDFLAAVVDEAAFAHPVAPGDGLEVYRASVRANLRAAMVAAYPVTARLVGDAFFAEAAARHLREAPSASGDLHALGAGFAAFLERYEPARTLPYLPDVARLEWALHESRFAADAPAFDFAALAAVPSDLHGGIRFVLAPAVRLVRSAWPIVALWQANQPDRDGTPGRDRGPDHVLVAREGAQPRPQLVDEATWGFLDAIARDATLAAASAAFGDAAGERLPEALAGAIDSGLIAAFAAPEMGT